MVLSNEQVVIGFSKVETSQLINNYSKSIKQLIMKLMKEIITLLGLLHTIFSSELLDGIQGFYFPGQKRELHRTREDFGHQLHSWSCISK